MTISGQVVSDHRFPATPDYAPYRDGPFRLSMGLERLALDDWIEPDDTFASQLREKERRLSERPHEVFAALPQAAAGSAETLALLVEHLPTRFPQLYRRSGAEMENLVTGQRWDVTNDDLHPLDLAGRLVQEDLCLMQRRPDTGKYHLVGASLCFPTRWKLADKLGKPLNAIHAPIPGYAEQLAVSMDRFFDRLHVDKPVWRLNWSVMDDPTLFQPGGHGRTGVNPAVTVHNAGDTLWLRMERQTLRRMPDSLDILFTIRVHVQPLSRLARRPERAAQLAAAIRALPEPLRRYKSLPPIIDAVLGWLDRAAGRH